MALDIPIKRQAVILVENKMNDLNCNASLLEILNTPLILYTIDHLLSQRVEHIFIACSLNDRIQIEPYTRSRYKNSQIDFILCDDTTSSGVILRQISDSGKLDSDELIVVKGDVITTLSLEPLLSYHRSLTKQSKDNILTIVHRKIHPLSPTRPDSEKFLITVDHNTNRILRVEPTTSRTKNHSSVSLSDTQNSSHIALHHDYMETGIYVFTRQGLSLLNDTDNCDIQNFPEEFYDSLLNNEVKTFQLHTYVLPHETYSLRITDINSFRTASSQLVQRHAYPYTADLNVFTKNYIIVGHNVLITTDSKLPRDALATARNVLVASDTIVEGNVTLKNSVIGKNCCLSQNSICDDSQIFHDTVVGVGAQVRSSVIAEHCIIDDGAIVVEKFVAPHVRVTKDGKEVAMNDVSGNKDRGVLMREFAEVGRSASTTIALIDEEDEEDEVREKTTQSFPLFRTTITQFVKDFRENGDQEMLLVQITSLKAAYNYEVSDTVAAVIMAFLLLGDPHGKCDALHHLKSLDNCWDVIEGFGLSVDEMVEILFYLCEFCDDFAHFSNTFVYILHALHSNEVISEDALWKWRDNASDSEFMKYVTLSQQFLTALEEADEEDDDDEEEEEEDDDDEEEEEEDDDDEEEEEEDDDDEEEEEEDDDDEEEEEEVETD